MNAIVLVVTDGAAAGAELSVEGELLIGRSHEADPTLAGDALLSRNHARIFPGADGTLEIEDLGSMNGTFVNDERIAAATRHVVNAGDRVRVGSTTLVVRATPDESADAADESSGTDLLATDLALPIEQIGSPSSIRPVADLPGAARPAGSVLYEGRQLPVPDAGLTIGRLDANDVVIRSEQASRWHARITADEGRYYVVDLGSRNGTFLNGEQLVDQARWLNAGDSIAVAGETLHFMTTVVDSARSTGSSVSRVELQQAALTIGRDPSNDVHLDDPSISRFHAKVVTTGGRVELQDLASRNGTRVDGAFVESALLQPGSEVGIGPFRLVYDGTGFVQRDDRGTLRLDAFDVTVQVGKRTLLNAASLSVAPGEFVVIIGESGSGKTTFLRALAGVSPPASGQVLVNGDPVASHRVNIGYVPQDDIVHLRLTVREALTYAGRLRLPDDSTEQDVESAVARVVDAVSLAHRIDNRIGSLSGGERKRVSLATELLNSPGLLFLDEPTTGLDPGLESKMMELFRSLAEVGKHALVMVTHATRSLDLVDKLCVMGRGGELCFVGPSQEAKTFFGVDAYDDIYGALEERPAEEWRRMFAPKAPAASPPPAAAPVAPTISAVPARALKPQAKVLIERYLKIFVRDRRNVAILLLQVPILAFVIAMLFKRKVLGDPFEAQLASSTSQLLFLIVMTTAWFGTLDSAREVIKERAITVRERAVGVSLSAYLASKVVVLFGLVAAQATILLFVLFVLRPWDASFGDHVLLFTVVFLTGFAAVSMGLAISSLVGTEDQATALIPISMIAQLLFGGAVVTVKNMGALIGALSAVAFSRWAYSGIGSIAEMNERIALDPVFGPSDQYDHSFFDLPVIATWVILLAFVAIFLAAALAGLRRSAG